MNQTKKNCMTAAAIAIVFLVTRFVQIPIPLGYINPGNCVILTLCLLLPGAGSVLAGGLGSALADLVSYPVYTIPTLVIKAAMPWVFLKVGGSRVGNRRGGKLFAAALAMAIPVIGYTLTGMVLYGSFYTGLSQVPGLLLEYGANLAAFQVIRSAVVQSGRVKRALTN